MMDDKQANKKKTNPGGRKKAPKIDLGMYVRHRSERLAADGKMAPAERNMRMNAARWEVLQSQMNVTSKLKTVFSHAGVTVNVEDILGGPGQEEQEGMMYAWTEELPPASGHAVRLPTETGRLYMYEWPQGQRKKEIAEAAKHEEKIAAVWENVRKKELESKKFKGKYEEPAVEEEDEGWGRADKYDRRWVEPKKVSDEDGFEDEDEDMGVGGTSASASASSSSRSPVSRGRRRPRSGSSELSNPGARKRGKKQMTPKKKNTKKDDWEDEDEDAPLSPPPARKAAAAAGRGGALLRPKKEPMKKKKKQPTPQLKGKEDGKGTSTSKGKAKAKEMGVGPRGHDRPLPLPPTSKEKEEKREREADEEVEALRCFHAELRVGERIQVMEGKGGIPLNSIVADKIEPKEGDLMFRIHHTNRPNDPINKHSMVTDVRYVRRGDGFTDELEMNPRRGWRSSR
uniref:Uncharacterized protein n=1 Tax=Chromera velia CCMP2878 TaxID=1169474 RepID=A0A0G4HVY1_9ALVE|eukprot:Cvel_8954.t1-p1 / transcript=Cvel_8954.t1 / gene=Cvel_8954 / organism=Chromera_velia_CCMP2878 / gene_product=hypothetical protein / transcript_product=hypothetical protein / location=Cvel_scaffold504:76204-78618(-) / protein_length=455 / sequence_SO=supercontig / SO=protein_coding / is_pseudo=false